MDLLLEHGALDVFHAHSYENRSAILLTVLTTTEEKNILQNYSLNILLQLVCVFKQWNVV